MSGPRPRFSASRLSTGDWGIWDRESRVWSLWNDPDEKEAVARAKALNLADLRGEIRA